MTETNTPTTVLREEHQVILKVLDALEQVLNKGSAVCAQNAPADRAADIVNSTGVQGGFVVHLGCGDGQLTAAELR